MGTQLGVAPLGRILLHDSIDPVTWTSEDEARNVDNYTTGGLAVVPVPEPAVGTGLVAGGVLLAVLARRRRQLVAARSGYRRESPCTGWL